MVSDGQTIAKEDASGNRTHSKTVNEDDAVDVAKQDFLRVAVSDLGG